MPASNNPGIPVALIRTGTSRGLFLQQQHLPADPAARDAMVLRLFGSEYGACADGLGGERPALRKLAIVGRMPTGPDGIPVLRYTFGQVDASLRAVDFGGECGNLAAGVPLFASLHGWSTGPGAPGSAWLHLANTGKRILAQWEGGDPCGGALRLTFVDPVAATVSPLPLGVPRGWAPRGGMPAIRHSVVSALNHYVFIDSRDLGVNDPVTMDVTDAVFDAVQSVTDAVAEQWPGHPMLKVCLVAPSPERAGVVRARILYPEGRWSHPGFAVTGAVTLATACCVDASVLASCRGDNAITIEYPGGTLPVSWTPRGDGLPAQVSIDRECRLLLCGTAF